MKMMKKLTVILASMVLLGTAAFAKSNFTAISLSVPINNVTENLSYQGTNICDIKYTYNSFGFGITSVQDNMFSTVDLSFVNKVTMKSVVNGNTSDPSSSNPKDSNLTWIFCNGLMGYPFKIIDNGTMQLILAPGFHVSMYSLTSKNDTSDRYLGVYLGAGAEAMFNYYLGSFCISAGFGFGYDFWGIDRYGSLIADLISYQLTGGYYEFTEKYKNISIKPRIGVGFNW